MRVFVVVCLAFGLGLVASPAVAQEAEVLRQELEQLKQQLQIMQQQYQKTIQDMSDRLQRLETQPPSPAAGAPTSPAPVATGAPATGPRSSSQISALDLARPREPFALYERRGAGQPPLRHRRDGGLRGQRHVQAGRASPGWLASG